MSKDNITKKAQTICDNWNNNYPIGQKVKIWQMNEEDCFGYTKGRAFVFNNTPYISLTNADTVVPLDRVNPVDYKLTQTHIENCFFRILTARISDSYILDVAKELVQALDIYREQGIEPGRKHLSILVDRCESGQYALREPKRILRKRINV